FSWYRCGASPPAISTIERCSVTAGRGATGAPPVGTVERRRIAAGRGGTYAPSIRPVEPGLFTGSLLVCCDVDEGHDQNREEHDASLFPAHSVHAFLLIGCRSAP